ncbi:MULTISPECIES: NAD-dependent epimerase/dehydratase family protein [unclassified Microbacterium]|uniref:NAD-dependent epimerase/dehydratase family protein n=1 Tax=unclassified Microbacterium TaxID=2609290 RepID=UPI00214B6F68|nr:MULTISPECIES: NAD-dependent epimerase/dehydratase family protein [unclassified Microbacterium]MCR2785214.1 NAD-dependent epimerase/dehydratase family protein [Microbacterium sp. zg.B96]WIM16746.1 NAD-dependent epimerase/dehydratase family protein [Microbacterium sp. zg-B96]
MRVVVTGAGGYIGPHVVAAHVARGDDVVAVLRPGSTAPLHPDATVVHADVLAEDLDLGFFGNPDALVHLAWKDGFAHNSSAHMGQLSAHFRFLTGAAQAGVPRIAALGTMHEVGYWEGPIDAATPTDPLSQYGIAKDALRRSLPLALADTGTSLAWLRCYYIYGDDRRNRSIFARLLEAVDAGRSTLPFTTGRSKYDFIRVEELGRQIAAVTHSDVTGVVNCSSGVPVSLADKVEEFITENALPISLEYGAFPDRPYDSPAVWGDATVIRQIMSGDAAQ